MFAIARSMRHGFRSKRRKPLFVSVLVALVTGTLFYSTVEGWPLIDSLYFSVVTLTTVGFGDLVPTKPVSKVFTIVYVLVGVGLLAALLRWIVRRSLGIGDNSQAGFAGRDSAGLGTGRRHA